MHRSTLIHYTIKQIEDQAQVTEQQEEFALSNAWRELVYDTKITKKWYGLTTLLGLSQKGSMTLELPKSGMVWQHC